MLEFSLWIGRALALSRHHPSKYQLSLWRLETCASQRLYELKVRVLGTALGTWLLVCIGIYRWTEYAQGFGPASQESVLIMVHLCLPSLMQLVEGFLA